MREINENPLRVSSNGMHLGSHTTKQRVFGSASNSTVSSLTHSKASYLWIFKPDELATSFSVSEHEVGKGSRFVMAV